jgi:hypothetical protein
MSDTISVGGGFGSDATKAMGPPGPSARSAAGPDPRDAQAAARVVTKRTEGSRLAIGISIGTPCEWIHEPRAIHGRILTDP